jgi:phosphopantetheine--protein transferase-like protein
MTDHLPLPPQASVGIDVVDLHSPRVLKGLPRTRTIDRVLTSEERSQLGTSANPATLFWTFWAAKEACFKSATLLRAAPPVFAHAAFQVDLTQARVRYGPIEFRLSINLTGPRLVALTQPLDPPGTSRPLAAVWGAGALEALHRARAGDDLDTLRATAFTEREVDAVRGLPSALVRIAARREAAAYLELDEDRLQVICPPGPAGRRPPYLYLDGRPMAHCGLSISHDGEWIAWAVAGEVREEAAGS